MNRNVVIDRGSQDSEPVERAVKRFYGDLEMITVRVTEKQQKGATRLVRSRESGQAGNKPIQEQFHLKVTG